jgi:hypothetical protein
VVSGSLKRRSGDMGLSNKYQYEFAGFGGVDNCYLCDSLTHVDEYNRSDGLVIVLCKRCMYPYMLDTRSRFNLINDECSGCGRVTSVFEDTLMCQACTK